MSLEKLINGQTIIIDDHKRGSGEVKNWDNPAFDIHIDKKTNFPIDGIIRNIRIRIPLNSERPIKLENRNQKELNEIPRKLLKEIQNAFSNKKKREDFIGDVIDTLKDFETILSSEKRASQVLKKISDHFNLEWTSEKIATYLNDSLQLYTQSYIDKIGKQYFITVDKKKIRIGENNGNARHPQIGIFYKGQSEVKD